MKLLGFILLLLPFCIYAESIDYKLYKEKYHEADYIILSKEVSVSYFTEFETGVLKAKSKHKISILALKDNIDKIKLIQIPFTSFEEVKIKSAKYYLLDSLNKKLLKENVKVKFADEKDYFIDGIFYNDLKVKQFAPTIEIVEKTILTYSYEVIYNDTKFLNRISIQNSNEIIENFNFQIKVPKTVESEVVCFNIKKEDLLITEKDNEHETITKYQLKKLTKFQKIDFCPPTNYFLPHFIILSKSWIKEGKKHTLLSNINDLYSWYNSLIKEIIVDKDFLSSLSTKILNGSENDKIKIEKIFKWVQENIRYVAFEDGIAGFKPETAKNVASLGYGDCKGMANLLVQLLRYNNISAYHTWIGTRRLSYDYSIPSLVVDNHMICAVDHDSTTYFLDATDNITRWNKPPSHIQGQKALVGRFDNYELIKVPITKAEENYTKINAKININKNAYLPIEGNIEFTGQINDEYTSWYRRLSIGKKKKAVSILSEHYLSNLRIFTNNDLHSNSISNFQFKGELTGTHSLDNNIVHIFCDIDKKFNNLKVDSSITKSFFSKKQSIIYEIEYILPVGTSIISLPENSNYTNKELVSVDIQYIKKNNSIVFKKTITINTLLIDSDMYNDWLKFIETNNHSSMHPVILKLN